MESRTNIPAGREWYRPDITGMRTLAIIPVVVFHAGGSFLPGGFIGVDVFFVISGFLITSLLLREAAQTGRIRLGQFWAKRIRRLVPALVLTVAVTLPVAALISTVLGWDKLAAQATSSVLYVANVYFWWQSDGYFDTGEAPSPYLHMWSLGVEEQFYLVWPLLIVGALLLLKRARSLRVVAGMMFGLVLVVSLTLSIVVTPVDPNAGFYLIFTRAWEFAAGGLLAIAPTSRLVRRKRVASAAGIVGIVGLVAGLVFLTEELSYPGAFALVPVIATVLLIAAGTRPDGHLLSPILESRPFVWVGNVSYSWYLWHWPLIVFAAAIVPNQPLAVAAAAVLSLGCAAVSYNYVEQPLRHAAWMRSSIVRTYILGVTATAAVGLVAAAVFLAGSAVLSTPTMKEFAAAAETLPTQKCENTVALAGGNACAKGDLNSDKTIALIGDSHAGHWQEAMGEAAQQDGYRLIVRWDMGCPSFDVRIIGASGVPDTQCEEFRAETNKMVAELQPDLVVISNAAGYMDGLRGENYEAVPATDRVTEWETALENQILDLRDAGAKVAVFDDNPRMPYNPTECMTRLGATAEGCAGPRADSLALIEELSAATDRVIRKLGVADVFSVTDEICGQDICHAVTVGGVPVYQDQTHLSRAWTASQVDRLRAFLTGAMP